MMFSIDLLKGKGLPRQTSLKQVVLKAVPFIIPMVAVSVFAVNVRQDNAELSALRTQVQANQQQIAKHKDEVAAYQKMNGRIKKMKSCLSDISKALNYRIQVSDMTLELVNLLPEDAFIYEMDLNRTAAQERYTEEGSGEQKNRVNVKRILKLTLCSFGTTGNDDAVQAYVNNLRQSPVFTEIVTDVKPSARQQGQVDGRSAVYYEIECTLKEQG